MDEQKIERTLDIVLSKLDAIGQGQKALEQGQKDLVTKVGALEQGQKDLVTKVGALEQGQKDLINRVGALEQGQELLVTKVDVLEQGQKALEQGQKSLEHGQLETRKMVANANRKMDRLAADIGYIIVHVVDSVSDEIETLKEAK